MTDTTENQQEPIVYGVYHSSIGNSVYEGRGQFQGSHDELDGAIRQAKHLSMAHPSYGYDIWRDAEHYATVEGGELKLA